MADAFNRSGRGKAPGLSGWTRELGYSIFKIAIPPSAASQLSAIFSQIAAVEISEGEKKFLKCAPLLLLKDKTTSKIRPLILKDYLTKLLWSAMLKICMTADKRIGNCGSSFGKKNAIAAILTTLQRALDDDRYILSLDATNAFNTSSRHTAFDYLKSSIAYDLIIPFVNLFYSEETWAILFYSTGEAAFTQSVTHGCSQGCTSGPWFFHICTYNAIPKALVLNVADDVYIVEDKPENKTNMQKLILDCIQDLSKAGLNMLGSKTKVIGTTAGINRFRSTVGLKTEHVCKPCPALGSVLYPNFKSNGAECHKKLILDALQPKLHTIKERIQQIFNLQASKQIQFQLLRAIQWYHIYLASTLSGEIAAIVCREIDNLYSSAALKICNLEQLASRNIQILIHTPLEEDGLGLLPYVDIQKRLADATLLNAVDFLKRINIDLNETPVGFPSIHWLWKHINSTRSDSTISPATNKSWLESWPNLRVRILDDEHFIFAMHIRTKNLPTLNYVCQAAETGFDFKTATASERFEHFFSCPSCAAGQNHKRHNLVVAEIGKTLSYHGIVCETNPSDLPLPGKSKGGPDFMIYEGSNVLVGDVAITKNSLRARFNQKSNWYESFSNILHATTAPFVMSITGQIDTSSIAILNKFLPKHVISDISSNVQFASINGMFNGFHRLSLRQHISDTVYAAVVSVVESPLDDLPSLADGVISSPPSSTSSPTPTTRSLFL